MPYKNYLHACKVMGWSTYVMGCIIHGLRPPAHAHVLASLKWVGIMLREVLELYIRQMSEIQFNHYHRVSSMWNG